MTGTWRSLVSVNALVFVSVLIGFANNVLIAALFGLTSRVDAFFAAMMLPTLFMILCIDYLGKNFLPLLAVAKREGEESASAMTSSIVTLVTIAAVATTFILVALSEPILTLLLPGFDGSETYLVSRYFWIMAPAITLMAVSQFHEYVCHYDGKFVQVAVARMMLPIANTAGILMLGPIIGEYSLPCGYVAGHLAMFIVMTRLAKYRFRPHVRVRPHLERRVFTNSAILMGTGFVGRAKSIVMNYLASSLGTGAISALAFATKLTEPITRCAFQGVRMVLFSRASHLFADDDRREVERLHGDGLRAIFLLMAPLLWWIGLNTEPIVRLMFARGEFGPQMTSLVAVTLAGLVPSILFVGVNQLLANVFYAMDRVKVPALIMPAGMLIYTACAVPLSEAFGTLGLALATSVMSIFVFGALFTILSRELVGLRPVRSLMQLLGYTALAGILMVGTVQALSDLGLSDLVVAIAAFPAGTLAYAGALLLVGDEMLLKLLRFFREWYANYRVAA